MLKKPAIYFFILELFTNLKISKEGLLLYFKAPNISVTWLVTILLNIHIIFNIFNSLAYFTKSSKPPDLVINSILAHPIITNYRLIIKLLARGRNKILDIIINIYNT